MKKISSELFRCKKEETYKLRFLDFLLLILLLIAVQNLLLMRISAQLLRKIEKIFTENGKLRHAKNKTYWKCIVLMLQLPNEHWDRH